VHFTWGTRRQPLLSIESGSLETLVKLVKQSGGMTLLPYLATLD
jgi:hypothetical protein